MSVPKLSCQGLVVPSCKQLIRPEIREYACTYCVYTCTCMEFHAYILQLSAILIKSLLLRARKSMSMCLPTQGGLCRTEAPDVIVL